MYYYYYHHYHFIIEQKWLKRWEKDQTNKFSFSINKKKYYILDMFPYPSASGLHIGHARSYTISDIIARYKKHCGFNVFHPIGWDAFGLPAEQFAIRNNQNPRSFNEANINAFREQLKKLGFYYDYDYEVNTSDQNYYRWTQWIFTRLYQHGLVQLKDVEVNWCQELQTVLANDEIVIKDNKMFSERGSFPVTKKNQKQWVLNITKYAQRLSNDLIPLEWDDSIKQPQLQWIGLSDGCLINFKTTSDIDIKVFTTRPDTIYGVSFVAIAPENELLSKLTTSAYASQVKEYIAQAANRSELQRKSVDKEKTGMFIGTYAINPLNNQRIPIYVADYVLNSYATGIVMGVPAHDQRDWSFAKKYDLPITKVIESKNNNCAYEGDGIHINSPIINGLNTQEANQKIIAYFKEYKIGEAQQVSKLHDWVFSRQRYWGEPFPIIYDKNNHPQLVDDNQLPVVLPSLDNYQPNASGKPPLANAKQWCDVVIKKQHYTREIATMPGSAGSSWYFLAYLMKNSDGSYLPIDSKQAIERFNQWMPVDLYVGGNEHATGHCLYARFWHKFLYDLKLVKHPEPFKRCIDHGIILGPDGNRMSKSKGNVISPSDVIQSHGADALRLYSAFIGPINGTFPWNKKGLDAMYKWLQRVERMFSMINIVDEINDKKIISAYHHFIKQITKNLEDLKLNTAVSQMMIYVNFCYETKIATKKMLSSLIIALSCFCPFLCEEIWHTYLKNDSSVVEQPWPQYDETLIVVEQITIPIQINGKLRSTITVDVSTSKEEIISLAKNDKKIISFLNKPIKKEIYIENKIINFIV